jgi:hypothetical protein
MLQSDVAPVLLSKSHVKQGTAVLARAFQHDPVFEYLVDDSARMLDTPLRFYQANIRMGLLYGEVYTTPSMEGVAVWISPGNTDFTFGQMLRSGFLTSGLSMGLKTAVRFMRTASTIEELKKEAISRPRWALLAVGVDPTHQGAGLGGTLIHPILSRADSEGMPCYLESEGRL